MVRNQMKITSLEFLSEHDKELIERSAKTFQAIDEFARKEIDKLQVRDGYKTFIFICNALEMIQSCIESWNEMGLNDDIIFTKNLVINAMLED